MMKKKTNEILKSVYSTAKNLYKNGTISKEQLKEIKKICK